MAAKYWIKLYHEILRDRKMVTLDDHLYRRCIECFLMAGENDKEGYLPSLADMAFELRIDGEELETDLNELIRVGILEVRDGYYFVAKFKERQGTMTKAEYNQRRREGEKLLQYDVPRYQPVTIGNTEKIREDKETDTDKEVEAEGYTDHDFHEFIAAFSDEANLMPSNGPLWVEPTIIMLKQGYRAPDARRAVQFNKAKGYSYSSPKSILNTIKGDTKPIKQSNLDKSLAAIERSGEKYVWES